MNMMIIIIKDKNCCEIYFYSLLKEPEIIDEMVSDNAGLISLV